MVVNLFLNLRDYDYGWSCNRHTPMTRISHSCLLLATLKKLIFHLPAPSYWYWKKIKMMNYVTVRNTDDQPWKLSRTKDRWHLISMTVFWYEGLKDSQKALILSRSYWLWLCLLPLLFSYTIWLSDSSHSGPISHRENQCTWSQTLIAHPWATCVSFWLFNRLFSYVSKAL